MGSKKQSEDLAQQDPPNVLHLTSVDAVIAAILMPRPPEPGETCECGAPGIYCCVPGCRWES